MAKKEFNLPDFIIIGSNKAGTTSVANYLNLHPKIKMSTVKEPMFFSTEADRHSEVAVNATLERPFFTKTLDEYSEMFEDSDKTKTVFGEASTSYLANPKRSAALMKKIVPNVKLIAILREPVDRAISAYKMCVGQGVERRAFAEIVANAPEQLTILENHGVKEYIRNGLYAQLLQPYFSYFDEKQILLIDYNELQNNPKITMHKLYNFLNVDYHEVDYKKRYNTAEDNLNMTKKIDVTREEREKLKIFFHEELIKLRKIFDTSKWS